MKNDRILITVLLTIFIASCVVLIFALSDAGFMVYLPTFIPCAVVGSAVGVSGGFLTFKYISRKGRR